ncbi:MAG: hypothetical protein ACNA7K_02850 [Acholeplasmataceae bacterium]
MRKKEIKHLFKTEIESHIPEAAPEIDFEFAPQTRKKKSFGFSLTRNLTTVLAILVMALVVSFFIEPNQPTTPGNRLTTEAEVISFQAVSTVSLLTQSIDNVDVSYQPERLNLTQPSPLIDYVKPYLSLVEKILASDTSFNIVSGPSDFEAYETYMQFETTDLLGRRVQYVMHYNLILVDEDDDESEYTMDGILITRSLIYQVKGEKTIEADETSIEFKAMIDDNNYVESKHTIESDETSFEMKVVRFGQLESEIKFDIEFDDDETTVSLEFVEGNNEGSFEFEYVFEDGLNLIYIEFETTINGQETKGEMTVVIIVDPVTNLTSYRFYVDPDDDEPYEYETDRDDEDDEETPEDIEETEEDDEETPEDNEEDEIETEE